MQRKAEMVCMYVGPGRTGLERDKVPTTVLNVKLAHVSCMNKYGVSFQGR